MAETQPFDEYLASVAASTTGVSMVPGINGAGTGVVRVPYSANGEVPADNGFFIDDNPTTQVHRFRDRIFFGDGAEHTGRRTAPLGGTWLTEKGANYFEKNASISILTPEIEGRYGLVVGHYNGPDTVNGGGAVFGISVNEKDGSYSARAGYFETFLKGTAGGGVGVEVQVGNYTGTNPNPTSYGLGDGVYGLSLGVEAGYGYTVGDDDTPIAEPTLPAAAAMYVAGGTGNQSYRRWKKGIIFLNTALYRDIDGVTGNATAIQMATGHQIEWRASASLPGAILRSDVTAGAGNDVSVIFSNNKIKLAGTAANTVADFVHIASSVNYAEFRNATTGLAPQRKAIGTDTDVGFVDLTQARGQHKFSSHGNSGAVNLVIAPPVSAPVNYLTIAGAAASNPATIGAGGTDTNIDIRFAPKGTGLLRFGTHAAIGAETITGYITIKTDDGATRKLAVVS